MTNEIKELIHSYLDGEITQSQQMVLNNWVKACPENAVAFCEWVRLDNGLHDLAQSEIALKGDGAGSKVVSPFIIKHDIRSWRRMKLLSGFAATGFLILFILWCAFPASINAANELDKLIQFSTQGQDRTYIIRNLDKQPEQAEARRPPIDGAELYIRHPDQYVLIRKNTDGSIFVTGSDGQRSWSVPPDGSVRVSHDPQRFRGPLPGHQHGIPFVNLRSDLVQLRDAYVCNTLPPLPNGWRGLYAEKKSVDYRGPNRVELWYDSATGVIHRMIFDGMPQARGGPRSVLVELQSQKELIKDFFLHESHHRPDRRVIEEE